MHSPEYQNLKNEIERLHQRVSELEAKAGDERDCLNSMMQTLAERVEAAVADIN